MTPVLENTADGGRGAAHVYVEISPYDKADQLFHSSYDSVVQQVVTQDATTAW